MIRACFPSVLYHHSAVVKLTGTAQARGMQMGAMKADGFKVGFPDILCLWAPRNGCLMEFKRPKGGVVSDAQKEMHATLTALEWPVAIIKSVEEAHAFLKSCGAPCVGELV